MLVMTYDLYLQRLLNFIDIEIAIRKSDFDYIDFDSYDSVELHKKEFELILLIDVRNTLKTSHLPLYVLKFIKYSIQFNKIE